MLCKCGCGQEIEWKSFHKYYGTPEYIHGHSGVLRKGAKGLKGEDNPSWTGGKIKIICDFCNSIFFDWKSQNKKYCSLECRNESYVGKFSPLKGKKNPKLAGENNPNWKPKIKLVCEQCENNFEVCLSYAKLNPKFCCYECKVIYQTGKHLGKPRNGIHKHCLICNKEFYVCKSSIRINHCSRICAHKSLIGRIPDNKGKSFDEYYGEEKSFLLRKQISATLQGININKWTRFTGFDPYTLDFNEQFKENVRERDDRCCVLCIKTEEENDKKLDIHHIDYNKLNSFVQNCVSLCKNCHPKTLINRKQWKLFFQSLLKERYNYEYTEDQKMILDFQLEGEKNVHI